MRPKKDVSLGFLIGCNLKKLREKRFPTHGDMPKMCKLVGVSPQTWNKWEAGKSIPSDRNQRSIAKVFGISMAELRGDHSPAQAPTFSLSSSFDYKELSAIKAFLLEQLEQVEKKLAEADKRD